MKRIIFRIRKPAVFSKAKQIRKIKLEKKKRIMDAIHFLHEWDSIIPREFMYSSVCKKLKIEQSEFAEKFIQELIDNKFDINKMVNKLP